MLRKLDVETLLYCSCQDLASDAWSFGSNYHQSSQSRKMSIGIIIDSVSKCRIQKVQQAEDQVHMAAVKTSSKETSVDNGTTMAQKTSSKGNFTNYRNKEITSTSGIRNQRESTEKQTSPWISTKTLHHEPTSEAVTLVEKPSIAQGVVEMCNTSRRVEIGPEECSLRSFLIQTSTLPLDKSKQVKEDASTERRGKFACKVALEDMPEKEVKGKITKAENAGNASLRLKLQEILGTVSSPNKQCPIDLEQGAQASKPEQKDSGNHGDEPRQNSDTIESDTQSPEYAIRRPTTRSLAQKRSPAKLKSQNRKGTPASKEDHLEKNVFVPKNLLSRTLRDASTDGPLMVYGRRGKRKSHHMEASKVCEQNNEMKDENTRNNCKRVPVPEEFVYPSGGTTLFPEKKDEMVQPDAGNLESPVVEITEQLRNLQEHIDQKGNSSEKRKTLDSESDKQSPIFALKTPGRKSFPGFSPRSNLGQLHSDDHENITSKTEGICKVKSFDGFKREYKSNTPDESSVSFLF